MFCRPSDVASCPVIGNDFALMCNCFCRYEMIGAAFSSFGTIAEFMLGCAVSCCSNVVAAVGGSHVPAGLPTSLYTPELNFGLSTSRYPSRNSVALLSVGAPLMTSTFGFESPQDWAQETKPLPINLPTSTLLKLT